MTEYAPGGKKVIWRVVAPVPVGQDSSPENIALENTSDALYVNTGFAIEVYALRTKALEGEIKASGIGAMGLQPALGLTSSGTMSEKCVRY